MIVTKLFKFLGYLPVINPISGIDIFLSLVSFFGIDSYQLNLFSLILS
jgi:hypothetical protein